MERPPIEHPNRNAFAAGVLAGASMTFLLTLARALGIQQLRSEELLGSIFTQQLGIATWSLGLFIQLIYAGVAGMIYGIIFRALNFSSPSIGGLIGIPHWVVDGVGLGIFLYFHPGIPTLLPDPGYYGANLGVGTFLAVLIAHLVFGVLMGILIRPVSSSRAQLIDEAEALDAAVAAAEEKAPAA